MKQFKNRFAVKGSFGNLVIFENYLLYLGYTNADEKKQSVLDYRTRGVFNTEEKATHITCGTHKSDNPGQYRPAMNKGYIESQNTFDLSDPVQKQKAFEYARELYQLEKCYDKDNDGICVACMNERSLCPNKLRTITVNVAPIKTNKSVLVSYDNVVLFVNDISWVVLTTEENRIEKFKISSWCNPEQMKQNQKTGKMLYFSSKENAEKYLNENKPIFSVKQIKDAINKAVKFNHINATFLQINSFKQNLNI